MTPKQIAKEVGCAVGYVYNIRSDLAKASLVKPTEKPELLLSPSMEVPSVDAILDERSKTYGKFSGQARVSQQLKSVMHNNLTKLDKYLDVDQQEALDMIFNKIGRIINGDPKYVDSWKDIAGYATLVTDRLEGKER
jgi:hypothetical protein